MTHPFPTLPAETDRWMNGPIRGLILDVDGVLEFQGKPYPGAAETLQSLREIGIKLCFLTNSTMKSRTSCAARLCQKGFSVSEDEVITAASATAAYLRQIKPRSCWVLVEGAGIDEFAGMPFDTDNPEIIAIGDFREQFDFDLLNRILRQLKRGARLVGMQAELVDSSISDLELNVGSIVEMLARAACVEPVYIGKPAAFAFELALANLNLTRAEVAMVGDRISTDIQGAVQAGLRSVLVTTGEHDPADLINTNYLPDRTIASFNDLPALLKGTLRSPASRVTPF